MSEVYIDSFARVEHKFMLTGEQARKIQEMIREYVTDDIYPEYSLHNIYYDSADSQMIIASLEHPVYKEKLRLRSYGDPVGNTPVFAEIKKKYSGIVYKRRTLMRAEEAEHFLDRRESSPVKDRTTDEIEVMLERYNAEKKLFISYHRRAYAGKYEPDVRITFDTDIRWRDHDLDLFAREDDRSLFNDDQVLMEVKVSDRYPVWLTEALTELHIHRTSFSKYGKIYTMTHTVPAVKRTVSCGRVPQMEETRCLVQF